MSRHIFGTLCNKLYKVWYNSQHSSSHFWYKFPLRIGVIRSTKYETTRKWARHIFGWCCYLLYKLWENSRHSSSHFWEKFPLHACVIYLTIMRQHATELVTFLGNCVTYYENSEEIHVRMHTYMERRNRGKPMTRYVYVCMGVCIYLYGYLHMFAFV